MTAALDVAQGGFCIFLINSTFYLQLYNPHDESLICEVESAGIEDVDLAVAAAEKAFYEGEWGKMSARYFYYQYSYQHEMLNSIFSYLGKEELCFSNLQISWKSTRRNWQQLNLLIQELFIHWHLKHMWECQ